MNQRKRLYAYEWATNFKLMAIATQKSRMQRWVFIGTEKIAIKHARLTTRYSARDSKVKYVFDPPGRISGFSSQRINLSPFTKDFRGEEQINESNLYFSCPTT